uniref:Uncharacterized protein n=1 Tax=Arundo donax TaxID=35708 RepID=A0A0A8ZVD0_ARUDO
MVSGILYVTKPSKKERRRDLRQNRCQHPSVSSTNMH